MQTKSFVQGLLLYSLLPLHRVCWQPSPEGEPLEKREENGTPRVHGVIQDPFGGVYKHKSEDDDDIISDSGWICCQNYNCILSKVMEEEEDSSPGNNNSQLHNLARLELFKENGLFWFRYGGVLVFSGIFLIIINCILTIGLVT